MINEYIFYVAVASFVLLPIFIVVLYFVFLFILSVVIDCLVAIKSFLYKSKRE